MPSVTPKFRLASPQIQVHPEDSSGLASQTLDSDASLHITSIGRTLGAEEVSALGIRSASKSSASSIRSGSKSSASATRSGSKSPASAGRPPPLVSPMESAEDLSKLQRQTSPAFQESPTVKLSVHFQDATPEMVRDLGLELHQTDESTSVFAFKKTDPKLNAMHQAFQIIDTDRNGRLDAPELTDLLRFRGLDIDEAMSASLIRMYASSGDLEHLNFQDFCKVMADFEGAHVIDLTRAFVKCAMSDLQRHIKANQTPRTPRHGRKSLRVNTKGLGLDIHSDQPLNARLAFSKVVDGPGVHSAVFVLIVVDVICVTMEFLMYATLCDNPDASHRRLGDDWYAQRQSPLFIDSWSQHRNLASAATPGWCSSCSKAQHDAESVLHYVSVTILFIFAAQIFLVMTSYGLHFFKNPFFVLDAVVVGGALTLELAFHFKEGAFLIVLLAWRFGRIVHGLATSIEIGKKKVHAKINDVLFHQMQKKTLELGRLKERFEQVSLADLTRIRDLLKPSAITVETVDTVPLEALQSYYKMQIMNNHDVQDALDTLENDLKMIREELDGQVAVASEEAKQLGNSPHVSGRGNQTSGFLPNTQQTEETLQ